jgi:ectoine hydroxylase-related dioxygenase (phytanoyl-CoA dioxygenase family)
MKNKLKDILLYSFAAIGVCSLFIAATNTPQQTTSTVPESHVWDMFLIKEYGFTYNKVTGEVRAHYYSHDEYEVLKEMKPKKR